MPTIVSKPICKHCHYWEGDVEDKDRSGYCRRWAPRPVLQVNIGGAPWVTWPKTVMTEWCGEFEASDEAIDDLNEANPDLDEANEARVKDAHWLWK